MYEQLNFIQKLGIKNKNAVFQMNDHVFRPGDILETLDGPLFLVEKVTVISVVCKPLNWWGNLLYKMNWLV